MTKNSLFIYIILRRVLYLALYALDHLVGKQSQLIILCYHSISPDSWRFSISPQTLQSQINYLAQHFTPLSLSQISDFLEGKLEITRPSFVITFDDGYQDIFAVKQFFKDYHIRPTVFVLSRPHKADRRILKTQRPLLSFSQIKSLKKNGWEIGCHTATHMILSNRNIKDLKKQIATSKRELETALGFAVKFFSYPYGRYSRQVVDVVKKAKFQLAVSMDAAPLTLLTNRYTLPRIGIDSTHSLLEFRALMSPSVIRFRQFVKNTPLGLFL